MSGAHEAEPVRLSAALDFLRTAGLPGSRPGRAGIEDPQSDASIAPGYPAARWSDGPGRVLQRTDALPLTEVPWDRGVVVAAVRRVADLAHLDHTRIRVVDDPSAFPVDPEAFEDLRHDMCSGNPLRMGWVRQLGVLADRRNVRRMRDRSADGRLAPAPDTDAGCAPGHVLHADAEAGLRVESEGELEGIILSPVSDLVEAYAGFMLDNGASGLVEDWFPRDGVLEEFGIELEIGQLLTDAFCAGLGYLAVVDGEIAIAPRPALHARAEPGPGGRPRFHRVAGPAIEFADGTGLHFLEGIGFPGWMHRAIVDGALTMRYVRDVAWVALRTAAYPSMPPAALLDGLDSTLLDVGRTGAMLYRVDDMPDHDGPVWYLVMTDPAGHESGVFVPPEVGRRGSADLARAFITGEE